MSTITSSPDVTARPYFRHDQAFKDRVIASYRQSRDTIADVARAYGIRPDLLQRWISDAGVRDDRGAAEALPVASGARAETNQPTPAFLPIAIEPGPSRCASSICIELNIAGTPVTVHWPVDAASSCAAWLREVLR
ncbi:transposase [Diaphorobacter caeni]|uniref:transposase n=1 Tax=Diaphorobacter caeni TaxID=2784387 RepID=UPI00188E4727|nr:transposase [Diaphorobacter caeni]MBF5007087.1 transposase [Diaphorobacter caeni]